jgi:AcrR family transcriptional regulator
VEGPLTYRPDVLDDSLPGVRPTSDTDPAGLPVGYRHGVAERRTQAERRAESRERLIKAAIRLLATRGYAHTSLVEIGREAGLSRGLVSHHFGSKEACMRAVVEHIRKDVGRRATKLGIGGPDAVDRLLDVYFNGVRSHEPNARAMYVILIEGLTSTPGLRPAVAETNEISRSFIADLIAELVEPHEDAGPRTEIESIAVLVEAILRGVALQWLADPDNVDMDAAAVTAKAMIHGAVSALQLARR